MTPNLGEGQTLWLEPTDQVFISDLFDYPADLEPFDTEWEPSTAVKRCSAIDSRGIGRLVLLSVGHRSEILEPTSLVCVIETPDVHGTCWCLSQSPLLPYVPYIYGVDLNSSILTS